MTKEQKGALSWAIAEAKAYNFEIMANALAADEQFATSDAPADHIGDANKKVEAQSVRDAVIEECAKVVDQKSFTAHTLGNAEEFRECASALRMLKSAPPQKPVSDEVNNG